MLSKKTILLVINPISGGKDKAAIIGVAKDRITEHGYECIEYETDGKADIDKIRELYRKHKPLRVLVAGGDGTIKMAADALQDKDVIFGILPAGSANGLAVDLGFPTELDDFLEIAFSDNIIHRELPQITSLERMPKKREGKIYLDYLQNGRGKTMASIYSIRPREGAGVSTPLEWDEINDKLDLQAFNMKTITKRLQQKGDLWKDFFDERIDLKKILEQI